MEGTRADRQGYKRRVRNPAIVERKGTNQRIQQFNHRWILCAHIHRSSNPSAVHPFSAPSLRITSNSESWILASASPHLSSRETKQHPRRQRRVCQQVHNDPLDVAGECGREAVRVRLVGIRGAQGSQSESDRTGREVEVGLAVCKRASW